MVIVGEVGRSSHNSKERDWPSFQTSFCMDLLSIAAFESTSGEWVLMHDDRFNL
jgi:hypothetical protein